MNGVHDMGGMHNLGPVELEPDEPVFHAEWEKRAFALTLACGFLGRWNIDMSRFAREQMPPAEYLRSTYYEKWIYGLERVLAERGVWEARDVVPLRAAGVPEALRNRRAARMEADLKPRFRVGDRVRARNINPAGHVRLPRYARGKAGVVDRNHGVFILPDEHARSGAKVASHCYSVRFEGRELWGPDAGARDAVYIDLFDEYLEPA